MGGALLSQLDSHDEELGAQYRLPQERGFEEVCSRTATSIISPHYSPKPSISVYYATYLVVWY